MCDIVTIGDQEYETVGELRAVCPEIVPAYAGHDTPDDSCLCVVDLEATAMCNGYRYEWDIWGATFYREE